MGFWSSLASIAGGALAPVTGGLSLLAGPIASGIEKATDSGAAGDIGQTAGATEAGREKAMVDEGNLILAGNKSALAAPGQLAHNAAHGDVLANSEDASFSGLPSYVHVPTVKGGLRPSLLSPTTRALGAEMPGQAKTALESGLYTDPSTFLPHANGFDTALQGTALAGGFLNAAKGLFPPSSSGSPTAVDPNYQPVGPWDLPENTIPQITGGVDPFQLPGYTGAV